MSSLVDAENLCHQAILVNYATNTVTLLDPDPVPGQRRHLAAGGAARPASRRGAAGVSCRRPRTLAARSSDAAGSRPASGPTCVRVCEITTIGGHQCSWGSGVLLSPLIR